ncbi:MAG: EF-hand domain-containing protein [Planctomycetia bacterium]|nr:EF-hand domain-containing protein [Planctomycetia bacterium]
MKRFFLCVTFLSLISLTGCFGNKKPSRIEPPSVNASTAGSEAMKLYDKNGDGKISGDELDATPALKASLAWLDKNGDGGISADEIANRIKEWQAARVGLHSPAFSVTYNGKPVKSGTIIFTPEPFLGSAFHPATASITEGSATASCDAAVNPPNLTGMPWGFYIITFEGISNAPEKMGLEIADINPDLAENNSYQLELKKK